MSCGTCGIQASDTMQGDTGVPAGAPTSTPACCPYCHAFVAQSGAACKNPRCPGPPPAQPAGEPPRTAARADRDWDGMLSPHNCRQCGRPLNADGGHPAELYAGTYTGLCYACQNAPPLRVRTYPDGAERWSHPPSCPAHRRDRQDFVAYPDCPECHGCGLHRVDRDWGHGGPYNTFCQTCFTKFYSHPARQRLQAAMRRLHDLANTQFQRLLAASHIQERTAATEAQFTAYADHILAWLHQAQAALVQPYQESGWWP